MVKLAFLSPFFNFLAPEVSTPAAPSALLPDEIQLCQGVYYYPKQKRLVLTEEVTVEGLENLTIKTKKHLFLESGGTPEEGRPGYKYSIWQNSRQRDAEGRPVALIPVWDEYDNQIFMPLPLTEDGHVALDADGHYVCPAGLYPTPRAVREPSQLTCQKC